LGYIGHMRAALPFALLAALATGACGLGRSDVGGESAGPDASSPATDAAPPGGPCPADQPVGGSPCPVSFAGLCEYGTDPDYICNQSVNCTGGAWTLVPPPAVAGSGATCPTARDATCPGSRSQITGGQSCGPQMTCGYPDGVCDCTPPPIIESLDAAALTWSCDTTFPNVRPHLGSACATEGATVDYGACQIPEGVVLECTAGTWQPSTMLCPL
jgi:hypothetical protein